MFWFQKVEQKELVKYLKVRPEGASVEEINGVIGTSSKATLRHLRILEIGGLVEKRGMPCHRAVYLLKGRR